MHYEYFARNEARYEARNASVWLRLFVTSREEPQIKAALEEFEPKELRADEANNRADVEVR